MTMDAVTEASAWKAIQLMNVDYACMMWRRGNHAEATRVARKTLRVDGQQDMYSLTDDDREEMQFLARAGSGAIFDLDGEIHYTIGRARNGRWGDDVDEMNWLERREFFAKVVRQNLDAAQDARRARANNRRCA